MRLRNLVLLAALLLAAGLLWYFHAHDASGPAVSPAIVRGTSNAPEKPGAAPARGTGVRASADAASTLAAEFPLAAPLNAPDSTIARDLDTLRQIFEAWRANFPHDGNPVGENAEITAALTGDNRLALALIPKNHPAINAQGELCDRWGTPFRFHQLSGQQMEIRSAGPDRKFGTDDDATWTP